jgi:hypothetical protein
MFDLDQQLWQSRARFGPMEQVGLVAGCDLASVTFDRSFGAVGRRPVSVRFSMTWHWRNGGWKLVQSANTGPTAGQSAVKSLGQKP